MEITTISQLGLATLMPVAAAITLTLLRQHTRIAQISNRIWQPLVGVVYGLIAIYGTEAGIPLDGAILNVRDAAPLIAGLYFGGPAGIIAGVIGGVERWFAVLWGGGEFTRLACTLGTIFAGVFAAMLRKYVFNRLIPNLGFAFVTGVTTEVMHLLLVLITNINQPASALAIIHTCFRPMLFCVGLSTMLSSFALLLLNRQPLLTPTKKRNVVRILHARMLFAIVASFFLTIAFTTFVLTSLSFSDTEKLLKLSIEDVQADIVDASNENLLELTQRATDAIPSITAATNELCTRIANELGVAEVNVINDKGFIVASNIPDFVGFDMSSGKQAKEFLVLLPGGRKKHLVQKYQPISYDNTAWRKYAGIALRNGFVQVGYDTTHFLDDLSEQVEASVENRHVGMTGAFIIIDQKNNIISTSNNVIHKEDERFAADTANTRAGQMFTSTYAGQECFVLYQEVEGYRIIAFLPTKEAYSSRNTSLLILALIEVLIFAVLFLAIHAVVKLKVVRGVRQMTEQLTDITNGNLDIEVDVHTAWEFTSLSNDINLTVGALKTSLATVQADLDMAAEIQANVLPTITRVISARNEFELFSSMEPAKEVGGDFYDFFMVDDDHLALVVADVSGKGVPAALFMMLSKTVIKMEALTNLDPATVLLHANADLTEKNNDDMFTTCWLGVFEISTGTLVYADAGHEKLAILRNGTWELPHKPNGAVALAAFTPEDYEDLPEKYRFRNHTVVLKPGDAIFQYTDGVTEATNEHDQLFGEQQLIDALNNAPSASPGIVLPYIRTQITAFVQDAPQFDDITMLGLRYIGELNKKDEQGKQDGKSIQQETTWLYQQNTKKGVKK